jgi:D-alanine-D-alanine ligase
MNVVILHTGLSADAAPDDLDVLVQARAIGEAIERLGGRSRTMAFDLDMSAVKARLLEARPDVVFNLVEAVDGRGRLIFLAPALLDALEIPYTGASTEGLFVTSSKLLAKRAMRAAGLPTADWIALDEPPKPFAPGRYIVKSVWEHASIGLDDTSVVELRSIEEAREAIEARLDRLAGEAFAEAYIDGREFNLSLLDSPEGPIVLPPAEMRFVDYPEGKLKLTDYRAKWEEGSFEHRNTRRCFDFPTPDGKMLGVLRRLASGCRDLFGVDGYARVDFRVGVDGRPWILEVNANPCLSPDAGYAAAVERAGLAFDRAIGMILDRAVGRRRARAKAS